MPTLSRNVLAFAAWLLVAGTVIQVFLAGVGVFDPTSGYEAHRGFGYLLGLLAIALLILALLVRAPRFLVGLIGLVVVGFIVQSILVGVRGDYPLVAALHPLNGFAIVLLAIWFARDAWRLAGRSPL